MVMESEKWESCSSDGDFCAEHLKDEEDDCCPSSGSAPKLQFRWISCRRKNLLWCIDMFFPFLFRVVIMSEMAIFFLGTVHVRKASSRAWWNSEIGMAEVVERKGQIWTTTGIVRNGNLYCSVEETL